MSLMNLSSLRVLFPGSAKKSVAKKSVSEKMNRKLAMDSLEARVLLSVTPNTSYDVLVNTEFSANQSTDSTGNSIAVDSDGDFVVTWSRGDNIYRDQNRNVGWYDSNNELHFYTDRNFVDRGYYDEFGDFHSVRLTPYVDPDTGMAMVDTNIYARYFTDEVQRLMLDTSHVNTDNNEMLYDFKVQTGDTFVQTLTFALPDANEDNSATLIAENFNIGYKGRRAQFMFSDVLFDPLQNSKNIQEALEGLFGAGNVKVTATTALEYTVEFKPTVNFGGDFSDFSDVLLTCFASQEDSEAACHVKMERQPQEVQVFAVYEKIYDSRGEKWTYGGIDAAATAEQIMVAFQQLQNDQAQGNVMNPSVGSYSPDNGPADEVEVIRKWNYEISVVPVYGLGDKIIGFDITYVNSSGKQDMPELILTEFSTIHKDYYGDDPETVLYVERNPGLKNTIEKAEIEAKKVGEVHTLKQNSEEFRVNPLSDDVFNMKSKVLRATEQNNASVALDADGDFVFTWTSEALQTKVQGSFTDVYARTFSASMYSAYDATTGTYELLEDGKGYKVTSNAILVNTTTADPQYASSIAMDRDGNFTVVWAEKAQDLSYRNGIYMQRFDAQGNKIGEETRVDTEYTGEAYVPQVAMSPDGKQIAVSWNWRNPLTGLSGVHVALFGYSTDANNVTTFSKFAEQQVGEGLMLVAQPEDYTSPTNSDASSTIAFNKAGQFMVAWVDQGTDRSGAGTIDTYVSQFKWNATGTELKNGTLATLRDSYRVNSASFDAGSASYWSGVQSNPSIGLDADGDFVVSYDGPGIDQTENFDPTSILPILEKFITNDADGDGFADAGVNADLLEYFDPASEAFMVMSSHPAYGQHVIWIHGLEQYVTNGDSDSIIETILSRAKTGLRDDNGNLVMDDNGEPVDPGCTMEQYSRLSAILHSVFDLAKGEGNGVNFTMFDSDPGQGLYPGEVTILQSDSIANATRSGEDAKFYLWMDRTSYYDVVNYADGWIRDEDGTFLRFTRDADGNLVESATGRFETKPVNQEDFGNKTEHWRWQTLTIDFSWKGTPFSVQVDLAGCYERVGGVLRLNHVSATAAIENAIVGVLQDAWPRTDGYEGAVQVRALSTTDADTTDMRALDGTPFDLNEAREPGMAYSAADTCFEIQFSGFMHDAIMSLAPSGGAYYTTPCFQFDLNDLEPNRPGADGAVDNAKYLRLQFNEHVSEVYTLPEVELDADNKITNLDAIQNAFIASLTGFLTGKDVKMNINDFRVEIVELVRMNGDQPLVGDDGQPETYEVVEITFLGNAGANYALSINMTKPPVTNNNNNNNNDPNAAPQDPYADWEEKVVFGLRSDTIFDGSLNVVLPGSPCFGSTARSYGMAGVEQWASSMGMTPEGDFTFAWTQENVSASGVMVISESIFYRTFNEEIDTFGPEVVEMYYSDGQKIESNGQIELAPGAEEANDQAAFIVTFTENMMDWTKITTENDVSNIDQFKEHSVTNLENWQILKDGKIVENAISEIYFGMNASADPYIQNMGVKAIAENKWEAVLVLNPDYDWETGSYELVLLPKVQDANGNALNSDGTNKNGDGWESGFEIVAGSTETEVVTPGLVDPETGLPVSPDDPNGVVDTDADGNVVERDGDQQIIDVDKVTDIWSPTATAMDPEGDNVTVWTSSETGYEGIFAKIDYVKWDDADGRAVNDEGQLVVKVTDNKTAQFASVDMGGDGDFVVTWTQNDGVDGKTDWNVWARMYDLNGNAKGDAFMVNKTTDGDQRYSQVAVSLSGDFVITWQGHNASTGWDIYAQRYDNKGLELGAVDEVQVLSFTRDFKGSFQLEIRDVVGNSYKTDFIEYGVNAYATKKAVQEALDNLGIANIEFTVTAQSMTQIYIAMHVTDGSGIDLPEMGYLLKNQAGSMEVQTYQEGRYGEFMVNETTDNNQQHAAIDMDYEGNFVISWTSYGSKLTNQTEGAGDEIGQADIFARQFKSSAELGLLPDVNTFKYTDYITRVDGTDENPVTNSGIAYITVDTMLGAYSGSGVLLADGNNMYVLTAAHVVTGEDFLATPTNTGIYFYTTEGDKLTAQMDELFVYEGYNPQYGIGDLAIIKLTSSLKGLVTGYNINRDMATDVGSVYTRYGFGTYGEGSTGATEFEDFLMHTGQNKWEYSEVGLLYYDFDDGTDLTNTLQNDFNIPSDLGLGDAETSAAHGDSGGPCFVNNLVAGICHGGLAVSVGDADLSTYGTIGMDTQVAYFANWIDNITGAFQETIIGATGAEFRVNDVITGTQLWSDVALDADGDFVITWTSASDDTSKTRDIYAKRYAADGTAINDAFLVNTTTGDKQQISKIAMDADGDFVIVWESYQEYNDGSFVGSPNNFGIYAQRYIKNALVGTSNIYGNDGEIGKEFRVNTFVKYDQRIPNVAMTATGDMMFVWQSVDANGVDVEEPSVGIFSRTYYKAQDDAGPVVVGVTGGKVTFDEIIGVDEEGNNITETKVQENISIKDGDLVRGTLSDYLDITFDEQIVGQRGELGNNSMLILSNIDIRKDGQIITSEVIDHIECVGFAETDESYTGSEGNRSQKNIFRIIFKEGVVLDDGKYEVTVSDRVQDIFENKLDGNMDGEPGGKFELEFQITTDPEEDGTKEPLAPEFEPNPNPGDADTTDINNVANTTTAGGQKDPAIAMNDNGDYVTVWVSEITEEVTVPSDDTNTDNTGTDTEETVEVVTKSVIMGQRFSRYGEKIGSEFYVSDFMDGFQTVPDVAMDMYGNFVVTWTVNGRDLNRDGVVDNNERAYYDVYARVYDASGTAITPSFLVEKGFQQKVNADKTPYADGTETEEGTTTEVSSPSTTPGKQRNSTVAISPDCSQFVITWTNVDSRVNSTYSAEGITDTYGIFAQRFSISGEKIGSTFVVNTNDKYDQDLATVGMDGDYNVYVVWQSSSDNNTSLDIYARKFDANNKAVSGDVLVNTLTKNDQKAPVIAVNDIGQFVVAWATQTGSNYDVAFRCFDSNMNAYGAETIANSFATFNQNEPSVAITRNSENGTRFAVSWSSYGQEDTTEKSWGVYMNIYDGVETRNSVTQTRKEILVNSYLAKDESASDIAMTAYGDIGAVWMGPSEAATGDVVVGATDTDIFHKVYYNAVLEDYVPLEDGSSIGGIINPGQNKHSVSFNSTLENGGGTVTVSGLQTTIQTAANSNNKFVFQASAGKPTVMLNNVELELTGSGNSYVLDASNVAGYDCTVVVSGLGGEAVSVAGGIVSITSGTYTLTIKNASSFVFNGENVAVDFAAVTGEMLEVNGNSVALATKSASYRVEGCTNIIATAAGAAIARITGTDEEEQFSVNGNSVKLSGGKVAVDVRNFEEVYLSGAEGDQVVFNNFGAFTVQGNVVDYVGTQKVHASYFTNIMANAGGTATVSASEGSQIQVNDSALVIMGDTFSQTISGLNVNGNVVANMDSLTVGAVTLNGFVDASANVTIQNAKDLAITGSEGDETITMNGEQVSFSSASYNFIANGVTSLTVDGKGGNDEVTIYNSATRNSVSFVEGVAKVNANVEIRGCASVAVVGADGGNDSLTVIGSANNDTFTLSDTHFVGTVLGTTLTVSGANNVAIQGHGGNDTLIASDSASDDTFTLTPGSLEASVAGATWNADGIHNLKVYQINGGNDTLTLNDSAENENVVLSPKYVTMTNSNSLITASGFANIAVNSAMGNDTLVMYDSVGNDAVKVENGAVSMSGDGFFNQISGFRKVNLYSINGGNDTAEIKSEYEALDSIFAVEDENWTVKGIGFEF